MRVDRAVMLPYYILEVRHILVDIFVIKNIHDCNLYIQKLLSLHMNVAITHNNQRNLNFTINLFLKYKY